jgi:hypothetical protein
MTVKFQPDVCLNRDPAGWGMWLLGHALEHEDFRIACLDLSTPIVIPDFDIRSWSDEPKFVTGWLQNHQALHQALDQVTGVEEIDYSLVDLAKDDQFYLWLDDHKSGHQSLRSVLGIG